MSLRAEPKYIIDLNKKLQLFYDKTVIIDEDQNETELKDDPKYFIPINSYFNFDEDRIEFLLRIHQVKLKSLRIGKKSVYYKLGNLEPITIPIILSEKKCSTSDNMCDIMIHGNFKERLLHIFQFYQKEFILKIFYFEEGKSYMSLYSVSIPKINKQHDWDPLKRFVPVFNPEDIGGYELKKLFEYRFSRYNAAITQAELNLLNAMLDYKEAHFDDRFENYDFLQYFQLMMAIEDLDNTKEMIDFSLDFANVYEYKNSPASVQKEINQHLRHLMCDAKRKEFISSIYVIQAKKKLPVDVMEFDFVYIFDQQDYQQYHDDLEELADLRTVGKIIYIFGDLIIFRLPRTKGRRQRRTTLEYDRPYHIEFVPNRVSFRIAHRALVDMESLNMKNYLMDFEMENVPRKSSMHFGTFEWFNTEICDNLEQQNAIENIVNCTSYPSPFVIFGGPGTGKSSTIVEAIAQIVKLKPRSHILVTASSNSACDDIGNRLLKYVSVNKILRIYSPSFDTKPDKLDGSLIKISNFRNRKGCKCNKKSCPELNAHSDPTYEEFSTARVIIVTLITAGRVISAGVPSNHFDYIFIDEAGSVCEPHCYVPISGLGIKSNKINAQIVLSGDHKQLGPVVKNKIAKSMGLEVSLMERLMDTDIKYQRTNENYDSDFVIQLKQNYRNHPAIIEFSNVNFYGSQLIPICSDEIKNLALDKDILMNNPQFPILFHSTSYRSEEVGTSLKNEGELFILTHYLTVILKKGLCGNKIEQSDIGIIAPYRGQRDRMFEEFSDVYKNIEIGTVDSFQGREKKIILVSCVRSGTTHVGFLRNEKRLNVALTRAQSLLIVIGNANTLQKCTIWNKFITYCHENRAIYGDKLSIDHENIGGDGGSGEVLPEDGVDDEYDE